MKTVASKILIVRSVAVKIISVCLGLDRCEEISKELFLWRIGKVLRTLRWWGFFYISLSSIKMCLCAIQGKALSIVQRVTAQNRMHFIAWTIAASDFVTTKPTILEAIVRMEVQAFTPIKDFFATFAMFANSFAIIRANWLLLTTFSINCFLNSLFIS